MNENLPVHVATSLSDVGTITYANEVIAIIAGMAASEIDGVAEMGGAASIVDILGRGRKPVTKGVRVEVGSEEASVDLVLTVEYGKPIHKVCRDVQESVRKSIETMTGLHVVKVDVHVLGVSFEREAQEQAEGMQRAKMAQMPLVELDPTVKADDPDPDPMDALIGDGKAPAEADDLDGEDPDMLDEADEFPDVDLPEDEEPELGQESKAESESDEDSESDESLEEKADEQPGKAE